METAVCDAVFSWLPWALATPVVMRLGRRFSPRGAELVDVAGASGCVRAAGADLLPRGALRGEGAQPVYECVGPRAVWQLAGQLLQRDSVIPDSLWAIVRSATCLIRERGWRWQQTETARLNEQLSKAQLNALRRQIEPHFLFNTLNAVAGLVREGRSDAAVRMIAGLSDFLRRVLEDSSGSRCR